MTKQFKCLIDRSIQKEYNKFVVEKYNTKWGKVGLELSNAMKLQLALEGNVKYQDDPDVQGMLKKVNQVFNTKPNESKSNTNNTLEEMIEKKLEEKLEILTKRIENKVRRESSKKHGLAEFKKQFQMAFNDYHQVSKREVEQFIMNQSDIVDKRSIKSRIQYLESHGILEPFAPNVYNVK